MSSNYALYVKEREGKDTIENDKGFITYLELDKSKTLYISDLFVKKEYRSQSIARDFFNKVVEIAKNKDYNSILASIDIDTKTWEFSKMIMEENGFIITGKQNNLIFFIKELNNGQ